jgi:hypothetical protein
MNLVVGNLTARLPVRNNRASGKHMLKCAAKSADAYKYEV